MDGAEPMLEEEGGGEHKELPSAAVTFALGEQLEEARVELDAEAEANAGRDVRPASPPPRTSVPMRVEPPNAREDEDEGDEVWLTPRADLSPTATRQADETGGSDGERSGADASGAEKSPSIAAATQRTLFSEDADSEDRSLVEVQSLRASVELAQHERDELEAQAGKASTPSRDAPPHAQREQGEAVYEEEDEIEVQSLRASVEQGHAATTTAEPTQRTVRHESDGGKLFLEPLPVAVSASLGSDKSVADLLHTLDEVRFEEQDHAASVPTEKGDDDDVQSRAPLMRPYTFRKQGRVEQLGDEKDAATAAVPSPRTSAPIASPSKSATMMTSPRDTDSNSTSTQNASLPVNAEKAAEGSDTTEGPKASINDARDEFEAKHTNVIPASRAAVALAKVASLERTVRSLRVELATKDKKIQELERSKVEVKEAMRAAGDANECLTLTAKSVLDFKRELEEQEQLIVGYQQENESAMARVKELENAIKHKDEEYGEERKRTAEQMNILHGRSDVTNAEQHAKLKRLLELEAEKATMAEEHEVRVREMRLEIERLREGKKEAEQRAAGIDPAAVAEGDAAVDAMRSKLTAMQETMDDERKKSTDTIKDLEDKLRWYVGNQELASRQDERVDDTMHENEQLRAELKAAKRDLAVGTLRQRRGGQGEAAAKRRIRELEGEVSELKEAIKKQFPNSLPAMMIAAKPSPEETEAVVALKATIESLKTSLATKDKQMEKSLDSLRHEHDKLRIHYEGRLATTAATSGTKATNRAKDLEKQVDELRAFYGKKVKDLQKKLEAAQQQAPTPTPATAKSAVANAASHHKQQQRERIAQLERQLKDKDAASESLRQQLRATKKDVELRVESDGSALIASLRTQLAEAIGRMERAERVAAEAVDGRGAHSRRGSSQSSAREEEVQDLRRQLDAAEITRQTLQRAHSEAIERVAMMTLEHERQYSSLQDKFIQRVKDESQPHAKLVERLQSAEADAIAYKRRVDILEQSLQSEEDIVRKHQQLEVKLRAMEATYEERERFWKDAMSRLKAQSTLEMAKCNGKFRAALKEKNGEISHFKSELEKIMHAALRLKKERVESVS